MPLPSQGSLYFVCFYQLVCLAIFCHVKFSEWMFTNLETFKHRITNGTIKIALKRPLPIFKKLLIYLFIYLWLCWVFVSVRGLSLVAASGGHSSSRCAGLSLSRPLLLRGAGSRRAGSVVVAHRPSRSAACGIFPDQGSNPCSLHWQADSQPLRHQGSPRPLPFLQQKWTPSCVH